MPVKGACSVGLRGIQNAFPLLLESREGRVSCRVVSGFDLILAICFERFEHDLPNRLCSPPGILGTDGGGVDPQFFSYKNQICEPLGKNRPQAAYPRWTKKSKSFWWETVDKTTDSRHQLTIMGMHKTAWHHSYERGCSVLSEPVLQLCAEWHTNEK